MIGQYVWKDFGRWVHLSHHTIFIEIRNAIWETKRPDFGNQTFAQYINWEKVNNQKRISYQNHRRQEKNPGEKNQTQ